MDHPVRIYPNPVREELNISLDVTVPGNISISIFDLSGRQIKTVLDKKLEKGTYVIVLPASMIPAGMNLVEVRANDYSVRQKISIVR